MTSNRDTAEWLAAFDETLLAQSAVDRFIHNAYDLVVEGESYRARLKPKLGDDDPRPSAPNDKKQPIGKRRWRKNVGPLRGTPTDLDTSAPLEADSASVVRLPLVP